MQARERLATYAGRMTAKIAWSVNGGAETVETRELGNLPIMVKVSSAEGVLIVMHGN